jgi:hypothetical protein
MNPGDALASDMVDKAMAKVLRAKSKAQRLAIAHGMWSHARRMLTAVLRDEHPEWSEAQIEREAALRLSHGAV